MGMSLAALLSFLVGLLVIVAIALVVIACFRLSSFY